MEERVRSFNKLPRPKQTPSGLPNHWVFGVCHVDLHPPGDLVLAVQPQSSYLLQGGPAQILSLGTGPDKAEAIIPCLLDAFITGGALNPMARQPTDPPPFAPWTWSTLDPEIAEAVQDGLRNHGIRPELCQVGICSAEERDILETARARIFEMLLPAVDHDLPTTVDQGDSTRCHGCGMSRESFFQPLKKCARCNKAFYHSKECQKKHWKQHKPACLPLGNVPDLDAYTYYNSRARADPAAQALMRSLNLGPPPPHGGIALPLRRLVVTGQDTSENMQLLFGPQWERHIKEDHETARIECLLNPPPGSPSHVMNAWMDDGSLIPSPRPATEAEQQRVKKVKEMQALIQRRIGVGKSPSSGDMQAILANFGANWSTELATYTLAKNTMDQGVPSGGYRA
ncbi:hypothetical protein C8A05DRAFT_43218 [Staphylotrichum tortipilum]|uniref:MYND-type domain-containing protein n=1 Tax=Staphylotrichum tortipilum TaxID=2831512 RepID=A0AAN6MNF8_9PEZI|nr:hypothetical protein C8A05DRAFT_43218 [Staphylotrichum longicolle]